MDTGHLHLMLNHLPVLGAPALLGLLAWGLAGRMPSLTRGALWLIVALAAVTLAVYLTGEAAEELVEGLPSFRKPLVEQHEKIALWATVLVVATGVFAAVALWRSRRGPDGGQTITRLVLLGLAVSTGVLAWTAWTGGPIGHPELRPAAMSPLEHE
jgi:hypothetical protein